MDKSRFTCFRDKNAIFLSERKRRKKKKKEKKERKKERKFRESVVWVGYEAVNG